MGTETGGNGANGIIVITYVPRTHRVFMVD
jgi:hypothetical protein